MTELSPKNQIGLYRLGTRVLDDLRTLDLFQHEPWTSGYLEGLMDAPFLQLTPGTRSGVVFDDAPSGGIWLARSPGAGVWFRQ